MRRPAEPSWSAVDAATASTADGSERTVMFLRRYFGPVEWKGSAGFSGSAFESFGGGGDAPGVRDRWTSADLVAVSMLGVNVPARAAVVLTEDEHDVFQGLLGEIPTELALPDVPRRLDDAVRLEKSHPQRREVASSREGSPCMTGVQVSPRRSHHLATLAREGEPHA